MINLLLFLHFMKSIISKLTIAIGFNESFVSCSNTDLYNLLLELLILLKNVISFNMILDCSTFVNLFFQPLLFLVIIIYWNNFNMLSVLTDLFLSIIKVFNFY